MITGYMPVLREGIEPAQAYWEYEQANGDMAARARRDFEAIVASGPPPGFPTDIYWPAYAQRTVDRSRARFERVRRLTEFSSCDTITEER